LRWIQITLPQPMAELLRDSVTHTLRSKKKLSESDTRALGDLGEFLQFAHENPTAFPPSGTMAASLKVRARRAKNPVPRRSDGAMVGEIKPKSRRKVRRPTRHQRRLEAHKIRRQNRRAEAAIHNATLRGREQGRRDVARHGSLARSIRERLLPRGRSRKSEGEDPHADL
jgi:hypothetical protein